MKKILPAIATLLFLSGCGTTTITSSYDYSGPGSPKLLIDTLGVVDEAVNGVARGILGEPVRSEYDSRITKRTGGFKTRGGTEYNYQQYDASGEHEATYGPPCLIGCN